MFKTTLCYIEKDGKYLMLYRNKKTDDPCEGKWVGIGGKFEEGESADECLLREVFEETSIKLTEFKARGIIHFKSNVLPDEDMYLYTASVCDNDEITFNCPEGELKWIPKEEVLSLNLWEGDKYFLEPLIAGKEYIEMTCVYEGDKLMEVKEN